MGSQIILLCIRQNCDNAIPNALLFKSILVKCPQVSGPSAPPSDVRRHRHQRPGIPPLSAGSGSLATQCDLPIAFNTPRSSVRIHYSRARFLNLGSDEGCLQVVAWKRVVEAGSPCLRGGRTQAAPVLNYSEALQLSTSVFEKVQNSSSWRCRPSRERWCYTSHTRPVLQEFPERLTLESVRSIIIL